jgi:hypothetical protein
VTGLEFCLPANLLVACCGVGGRSLAVEEKALSEGIGKRSYAEALVGMGQSPETAIEYRGSVGFSNCRVQRVGVASSGGVPWVVLGQSSFYTGSV